MTPADIMTAGLDRGGARGASTAKTDRARLYLNLVLGDLWTWGPWRWQYKTATITTSASTRVYALAAAVDTYENFYDQTNDTILLPAAPFSILRADPDESLEANPRFYATATNDASGNQQIDLYPTPGGTYTIKYEYRKRVPVLSSGDDGTTLDDEVPRGPCQSGLIFGVASLYMDEMGDEAGAAREEARRDKAWNLALSVNKPNGDEKLSYGRSGNDQAQLNVDTYGLITEPA